MANARTGMLIVLAALVAAPSSADNWLETVDDGAITAMTATSPGGAACIGSGPSAGSSWISTLKPNGTTDGKNTPSHPNGLSLVAVTQVDSGLLVAGNAGANEVWLGMFSDPAVGLARQRRLSKASWSMRAIAVVDRGPGAATVVVSAFNSGTGARDMWLIHFDDSDSGTFGNVSGQEGFACDGDLYPSDADAIADGVVVTGTWRSGNSEEAFVLTRTTSAAGYMLRVTSGNGLTGRAVKGLCRYGAVISAHGSGGAHLIRFSAASTSLALAWGHNLEDENIESLELRDIIVSQDSSIVAVGALYPYDSPDPPGAIVTRVTPTGELIQIREVTLDEGLLGSAALEAADGSFFIAGATVDTSGPGIGFSARMSLDLDIHDCDHESDLDLAFEDPTYTTTVQTLSSYSPGALPLLGGASSSTGTPTATEACAGRPIVPAWSQHWPQADDEWVTGIAQPGDGTAITVTARESAESGAYRLLDDGSDAGAVQFSDPDHSFIWMWDAAPSTLGPIGVVGVVDYRLAVAVLDPVTLAVQEAKRWEDGPQVLLATAVPAPDGGFIVAASRPAPDGTTVLRVDAAADIVWTSQTDITFDPTAPTLTWTVGGDVILCGIYVAPISQIKDIGIAVIDGANGTLLDMRHIILDTDANPSDFMRISDCGFVLTGYHWLDVGDSPWFASLDDTLAATCAFDYQPGLEDTWTGAALARSPDRSVSLALDSYSGQDFVINIDPSTCLPNRAREYQWPLGSAWEPWLLFDAVQAGPYGNVLIPFSVNSSLPAMGAVHSIDLAGDPPSCASEDDLTLDPVSIGFTEFAPDTPEAPPTDPMVSFDLTTDEDTPDFDLCY